MLKPNHKIVKMPGILENRTMFERNIYIARRKQLRKKVGSGLILMLGNNDSPMNYFGNTYRFRQDSTFLYFIGIDLPGLAAVLDVDEDSETLFGNDLTLEDIVWAGPQPTLKNTAQKAGIKKQLPLAQLDNVIKKALLQGRKIHYLPPYRADKALWIETLLGIRTSSVKHYASRELIQAVIAQRSIKTTNEIIEIESALRISALMYAEAMKMAQHGVRENEISGRMEGIAIEAGGRLSFPSIVTMHGETLHSFPTSNRLKKGALLLIDTGVESPLHYSSDITRTIPVGGKFSSRQKDIYETVLQMQLTAIASIKPGISYLKIHLLAAKTAAENLKTIGLMKGNMEEAITAGAHALFFPHAISHMLGLDVHDMEDLIERFIGPHAQTERSILPGIARKHKEKQLQPGFVLTVEPGIYFIPALIYQWKKEKKCTNFLNYNKIEEYINFGGIRIEDDILVTRTGCRVLGVPIPK